MNEIQHSGHYSGIQIHIIWQIIMFNFTWEGTKKSFTLVGGNVFKCCLPWCGSAEPKVDPSASVTTPPVTAADQDILDTPPKIYPQIPSPHLQDILEEQEVQQTDGEGEEDEVCIVSSYNKYYYGKKRGRNSLTQSPSPTFSTRINKSRKNNNKPRARSVTSTTSSEPTTVSISSANAGVGTVSVPKMQAEQGSIGELQKYHNRYLRNRRHTLANVRYVFNFILWHENHFSFSKHCLAL